MTLRFINGFALALPASFAFLAACGGTADVGSDHANVNKAGASNETGGSAGVQNVPVPGPGGGPGEAGASQGGSAGAAQGGAPPQGGASQGGMAGSGQAGSSSGTMCGGFAGFQCDQGEFCDFDGPYCGAADGSGVCRPIPQACTLQYDPVCGCDGKMYGNECSANSAGTDITGETSCFPQDGGTAPGGECKSDADCSLVDDYCGGCHCLALPPGVSPPKCSDPVQCFVQPCMNKAAYCDNGTCVAR